MRFRQEEQRFSNISVRLYLSFVFQYLVGLKAHLFDGFPTYPLKMGVLAASPVSQALFK